MGQFGAISGAMERVRARGECDKAQEIVAGRVNPVDSRSRLLDIKALGSRYSTDMRPGEEVWLAAGSGGPVGRQSAEVGRIW